MALTTGRFYRFTCSFSLAASLLLTACAAGTGTADNASPAPAEPAEKTEKPKVYRSFSNDTLYELLLAEFAGVREQVEPALEIYAIQAHETRDPAVIARGIHIARYLKRTDVIIDLSELWLQVEPDNVDVRRLLAFHLASEGRVLEAFPHGEYLLETGDQEYMKSLAVFALESPIEEKQRLLELYEELQARHPEEPGLLIGKAMLLRQLEMLEESLDTAQDVIDMEPENATAQLLNAQLLHALGDEDEALRSLRKALKLLPENKRLRLQYARFLSEEDLEESRRQIAILANLYPEDENILFSLGLVHNELGELEKARSTFNALIDQKKRVSDAQFMLGKIAEEQGQPEEAVFHYRQVEDGQNLLPATMRIARLYTEHDNLSAAREYLSSQRAIYPALRESLFQVEAELLIELERLNEAYDLLTSAIAEYEESRNLRYTRSIVSAIQEDMEMVEEDLKFILARDEDNSTALNALGYTMLNLTDRYEEALALIEEAYRLEPDNPAILDSLGWAHYRLDNLNLALDYLKKAFEAFPDGEVAAHLGEVLWVQGETEAARQVWQQGLEANPKDRTLRETLDRLAPGLHDRLLGDLGSSTE